MYFLFQKKDEKKKKNLNFNIEYLAPTCNFCGTQFKKLMCKAYKCNGNSLLFL